MLLKFINEQQVKENEKDHAIKIALIDKRGGSKEYKMMLKIKINTQNKEKLEKSNSSEYITILETN